MQRYIDLMDALDKTEVESELDSILDRMDEAWDRLTKDERAEIDELVRSRIPLAALPSDSVSLANPAIAGCCPNALWGAAPFYVAAAW